MATAMRTAFVDRIGGWALSRRIAGRLTGDYEDLRRPCMIVDNPQVLRKVVAEHLVPAGHEHSEDIIRDPKVVAWADEYSARLKELTDPVWEAQIADPSSRWYREKPEYKNLFRFKPKTESQI